MSSMTKKAVALLIFAALVGTWLIWFSDDARNSTTVPTPQDGRTSIEHAEEDLGKALESVRTEREATPAKPVPEKVALLEPYGTLEVTAVWAEDGAPAAGVAIVLRAEAEPAMDRDTVRLVTDEAGAASARRLHAGPVEVTCDRGAKVRANVEPGLVSEVRLDIPAGVHVEGVVVDDEDRPVSGATIWLTTHLHGWLGGNAVGESGNDGSFQVRSVDARQSLGARAPGYASSDLVDLEHEELRGNVVTPKLVLSRGGGVVEGRVTRVDGTPVGGAHVAIGRCPYPQARSNSAGKDQWSPEVLITDAEGAFGSEGVEFGQVPVTVRAEGFPVWSTRVVCSDEEPAYVEVVLEEGVTITGTVHDVGGDPVAGASVTALEAPFLHIKAHALPGVPACMSAFGRPLTVTDAKGEYTLRWVQPDAVHLLAFLGGWAPGPYHGRDHAILDAAAGDTIRWDARLSLGLCIRGRIETADGECPPFYEMLHADPGEAGGDILFARWDEEGRFQFVHCDPVPYTLTMLRYPGPGDPPVLSGVLAGEDEVILRLPAVTDGAPASVTGRIVTGDLRPISPPQLGVSLEREGHWRIAAQIEADRFMAANVVPGEYRVVVSLREDVVHISKLFEVTPGQTLDMGELVTEVGGAIVVRPVVVDGTLPEQVSAGLFGTHLSLGLEWDGNTFRADRILPRTYNLWIHADGVFFECRDVTIESDNELEVEVKGSPATRVPLRVTRSQERTKWKWMELAMRDSDGRLIWRHRERNFDSLALPYKMSLYLPVGSYSFEASLDTGHSRSCRFEVSSLQGPVDPVVLDLD